MQINEVNVQFRLNSVPDLVSIGGDIEGMLGFNAEDFLSGRLLLQDRIHPEDYDLKESLFSTDTIPSSGSFTFRLRQANSRIRIVRLSYAKTQDATVPLLTLVLQDAKSIYQKDSHTPMMANFKAMMENTNDYIYFKDSNHVFTGASQTLVSLCSPAEHWTDLLGQTDYDVFPEEYADIYYRLEKQVFAGIHVAMEIQETLTKDGKKGWVDNRKYPITDERGQIIGLFGVARDITESKLNTLLLEQSESRLLESQRIAGIGSFTLNVATGQFETSAFIDELFGIDAFYPHSIEGWLMLVHPDDRVMVADHLQKEVLACKKSLNKEYRIVRPKDQSTRWVHSQGQVHLDADGQVISLHGTSQDITERKEAEQLLLENEKRFHKYFMNAPVGINAFDSKGKVIAVNSLARQYFGVSEDDPLTNYCLFDDPSISNETKAKILQGEMATEERFIDFNAIKEHRMYETIKSEEDKVYIHLTYTPHGPVNAPNGYIVIIQDMTASKSILENLRLANETIKKSEFLSNQALELANAGHWNIDFSEGDEYYTSSPRLIEIFGDPPRNDFRYHIRNDWYVNLEAADKKLADATLANYLAAVDGAIPRYDMIHPYKRPSDGRIVWVHVLGHVERDPQGKPTHVYGVVMDITQQKLFEKELERQAHIDYLTGVSNRGHFVHEAELELSRAIRYENDLSLLMIDIDHFKQINDTHGHKAGDLVLKNLADVCRVTLREVDIIGRIGGEEFAVLLPETSRTEAAEVAERLRDAIGSSKVPIERGLPIRFTVSIGVSSLTSPENNLDVLLNLADKGLYAAKSSGRNTVSVVDQ